MNSVELVCVERNSRTLQIFCLQTSSSSSSSIEEGSGAGLPTQTEKKPLITPDFSKKNPLTIFA
jgi:hypothetical protein